MNINKKITKFTLCGLLFVAVLVSAFSIKENKYFNHQAQPKFNELSDEISKPLIQVAVIGGGIAGLAAAQITAKKGLHTVVFGGTVNGGQINNSSHVYNWLGVLECEGKDIIQAVKNQAEHRGALLVQKSITNVDFSTWPFSLTLDNGQEISALSVVVATGAQQRLLNVPGEVEYLNKGIIISMFERDGTWKGRTAAVIGSGDDAVRKAQVFAKTAKEVLLLVRGKELKMAPADLAKMKKNFKNIKIMYNTSVKSFIGDTVSLQALEIQTGTDIKKIACDVATIAIGLEPASRLFTTQLSCDKNGYILLEGRSQATSCTGIFAAGDVTEDPHRKAVVAGADGIKSGYDAAAFLKEKKCDFLSDSIKKNLYRP